MAKMCTVSRLERQFATLYLFHAPTFRGGGGPKKSRQISRQISHQIYLHKIGIVQKVFSEKASAK